jgi:hypothetical protein
VAAGAQTAAACTLSQDVYTCDWASFQRVFARAQTASVVPERMERYTAIQLRKMAALLGKAVVAPDAQGDVTFEIEEALSHGVAMGPSDRALVRLLVYENHVGTPDKLIWVETFRGQGDRPWEATVHAVIAQFEARFSKR